MVDSAWVALSLVRHLGGKTMRALLTEFGTPQAILQADKKALMAVAGVGKTIASAITAIDLPHVEDAIGTWQDAGIHIITRNAPDYPLPLSLLDDDPPTLFVRGMLSQDLWTNAIAIVGTRHPSSKAQVLAHAFGEKYAQSHYTIVSGLALGVDRLAHEGALRVAYGRTVAVLGSGVLNVYPLEHQGLSERILAQGGALICECAPDASVTAPRLVARNRLISGLVRALLLVETSIEGGAMHAVKFARQQGRAIYAVNLPASGNQATIQEGVEQVLTL